MAEAGKLFIFTNVQCSTPTITFLISYCFISILIDLGVAMGAGAALAMETSDITLMDSNLNKLLYSVKMGRRVSLVIKQNIIFSLVAKGVVVVLIFLNYGSLWLAIASDLGSMLIVTLNGMRLLPSKKKVRNMSFEMESKITVV